MFHFSTAGFQFGFILCIPYDFVIVNYIAQLSLQFFTYFTDLRCLSVHHPQCELILLDLYVSDLVMYCVVNLWRCLCLG